MYYWRFTDKILEERLKTAPALLIQGPKGCGKTETAMQHASSIARMDTDTTIQYQMTLDPNLTLAGETPRLIDEWQTYPEIWNYVRHEVDRRKEKGQFILTGSSTAEDATVRHSGAGRFSIVTMRTMSSFERGWSDGSISLYNALQGNEIKTDEVDFSLETLIEQLIIGGWPILLRDGIAQGIQYSRDYIDIIAGVEIKESSEQRQQPQKILRLLRSYARNISREASLKTLALDTAGTDYSSTSETISIYLESLKRQFVIEDLPAWNTHIRSSHTLRKSPKRHFTDPSLAVGALQLSKEALIADLQYTGLLFESMVIRDLRVYAQLYAGRVYHYRDSDGLEVDAIVEFPDGSWAAFEVKMGFGAQEDGARNLLKLADRIDYTKRKKPSLLAVITANGFAYQRKDGIAVIPISVLTA